ncbi:peptide chain release factor N(5)-glutamine methyltransferase [Solimonas marina]|uniref:Release factor glutamine methyltransferase n=1 Tax=Solimonas marina TaxID=2714601 RepID=A0A969WCE4_9GAMM|nr:peptide chain release factor N(5)-glutamine methyltransferase [Solimonas marina]NKF23629.1 peptide chain release factor N(5)-glutamine methyltransferase [Solimonas marina]
MSEATTLRAALRDAQTAIAASSDSARLDAEWLLAHVLGCSRTQLMMRGDDALAAADVQRYAALVARRRDGEPVAYLLGNQGFWSLELQVTPDVLVPRPETELLVEWALECLPADVAAQVVDLGTGSGAIALALARERPTATVTATDVSAAALAIASGNAERLGLAVEFREGAWWQACADQCFDLVVSNPPYIAAGDEHLPALRHEPLLALSDGADGLQALRDIIAGAPARLRAGGRLLLEHGYDQGAAVRALLSAAGFTEVSTRRDLEGRERASGGRRS